jgi:hypothetical protein
VQAEPGVVQSAATEKYGPPKVVGTIKNAAVNESSGLVASRIAPGIYWTHNDSADGPFIYAITSKGDFMGVWKVAGARAVDWEDISVGPGPDPTKSYLYIGDIGDNGSSRSEIVVYRVPEPKPTMPVTSTKAKPEITEQAESIRLRYPDGSHDAEALMVNPKTGDIFIVTKIAISNPSVYEAVAPFTPGKQTMLKNRGPLKIPSLFGGIITGGSVSPDGTHVALCDYFQAYEITLPHSSKSFNEIWKQPLISFDFGKRKQGESIAYRFDGRALLGTSEGKGSQIFQVEK